MAEHLPRATVLVALLLFLADLTSAQTLRVGTDASYLAAGEKTSGQVLVGDASRLPAGAKLRITLSRRVDIASPEPAPPPAPILLDLLASGTAPFVVQLGRHSRR